MEASEKGARVVLTPARVAEVDEAMWQRAREGDVAAAKVVYARLAEGGVGSAPVPMPPTWAELECMFKALQQQHKEMNDDPRVLDDAAELGVSMAG